MASPMIAGKHIFVVEDDPLVRQTIVDGLEHAGAQVDSSVNGAGLLQAVRNSPPDLALVDLRLPEGDGLSVLSQVRRISDLPVVIITGKGDEFDEVIGLESGADDFVRKPFAIRVLIAHMVSVLRRYENQSAWDIGHLTNFLQQTEWQIDVRARQLRGCSGKIVPLTATEVRLLNALAERPGQVIDRGTLYTRVFSRELSDHSRTIDVLVSRLRRKLQPDNKDDPAIMVQSIYGKGYCLTWGDLD